MVDKVTNSLEQVKLDTGSSIVVHGNEGMFLCPKCRERYEQPKVFPGCPHSVCGKCANDVNPETQEVTCPRCQYKCLPSEMLEDRLMQFLLRASEEGAGSNTCANCEESAALFCTTCSQSLCEACRAATHATRMFATHHIIAQQQHSRGAQNMTCPIHDKDYVMYSMDSSRLLCMMCFAEIDGPGKSHAVDVDCALATTRERLEASLTKLEQLQFSVKESIEKIEALLDETVQNTSTSTDCIDQVFSKLEEELESKRESLLEAVDKQCSDKVRLLQAQLADLKEYGRVVKGHLETGNVFSGATNTFQFLDLVKEVTDRFEHLFEQPRQLFALTGSQISCQYRSQIMKCIDDALGPNLHSLSGSNFKIEPEPGAAQAHWAKPSTSSAASATDSLPSIAGVGSSLATSYLWHQRSSRNVSPSPDSLEEARRRESHSFDASLATAYAERYEAISVRSKMLQVRLDSLKKLLVELHRDVTRRRCHPQSEQVAGIFADSEALKAELEQQQHVIVDVEKEFGVVWKEMLERVEGSKVLYSSHIEDAQKMVHEMQRLKTILQSIQPFVSSLSVVSEQLNPVLGQHSRERTQKDVMSDLLVKISSTAVNTQQRVEAIQTAEDLRLASVERKHSNPLEDNLIRTKELLKSRASPRRTSTGNNSLLSPQGSTGKDICSPLASKSDSCMTHTSPLSSKSDSCMSQPRPS